MVKNDSQLVQRRQAATKSEECALSLFHHVESMYVTKDYFYIVTIAKRKTTLFRLAMRYVS